MSYLIVGLISLGLGLLVKKNKAPKFIQNWLKKRDDDGTSVEEVLFSYVKQAETYRDRTGAEKKQMVVEWITEWASSRFNFPIPESIVDSVVEYVYQQYKKRT
ncbi:MAG: hypothetical protein ABFD64_02945 [Armatimonadota bacterium]